MSGRWIADTARLARGYRELRTLQWIPLSTLFLVATHGLRGVSPQSLVRLAELNSTSQGVGSAAAVNFSVSYQQGRSIIESLGDSAEMSKGQRQLAPGEG
jgi:hypothetical protein